ncbi:erythromycin esterase family protein [Pedobacter mucosus]|uniref:erythromycin esterase family protein n=1 Tax=Pedobacter mucosus TaxID=2895286 RepID=UPI001EE4E877|nr:erythromycin esterase family protein [Pedobacter mucosus]UKT65978.1 erythromycin esterase family protein [Pedobacter mucosus]
MISSCEEKDIKSYTLGNLKSIKTISLDSSNFTEFEKIGEAIGNSRIVMLGEQDHGDGPTFLAKTKLVKYLHEKKGFNVLLFESDFFSLNQGWDHIQKNENEIIPFLSENLFSIWTKCQQCDELLYSYIPKANAGKKSLVVSGFDSQIHGSYSKHNLKNFLDAYLKLKNINFIKDKRYTNDLLPFIDSVRTTKNAEKLMLLKKALKQIQSELPKEDSTVFESVLIKSLKANVDSEISFLNKGNNFLDIRDKQMAENLRWLVNHKFSKEKIVVWAANLHIVRHPELIKDMPWKQNTMGNFLAADKSLANQIYTLGFTSGVGIAGRITTKEKYTVKTPIANSLESWIPEAIAYAFIDFKRYRKENPTAKPVFLMKGISHKADSAIWTEIFDGLFYIRNMYPCAPGKKNEML